MNTFHWLTWALLFLVAACGMLAVLGDTIFDWFMGDDDE